MITAKVTIATTTGYYDLPVEVTDVFTLSGGRRIVCVEALPINGRPVYPFSQITHGGNCQYSTALFGVEHLKDITTSH